MFTLGPLGFAAPWLLVGLIALPILWLLLRAVPPAPIRRRFPGVALLLGLPGKLGMSGDKVWDAWRAGKITEIRDYCETDVLNTYLVYLRFELIRGHLAPAAYDSELERVRSWLRERNDVHWKQFAAAWNVS